MLIHKRSYESDTNNKLFIQMQIMFWIILYLKTIILILIPYRKASNLYKIFYLSKTTLPTSPLQFC